MNHIVSISCRNTLISLIGRYVSRSAVFSSSKFEARGWNQTGRSLSSREKKDQKHGILRGIKSELEDGGW